jgi:hypothetical protein
LFKGHPHLTQLKLTRDGELERRSKGKQRNCEEKEATVRSCWSSAWIKRNALACERAQSAKMHSIPLSLRLLSSLWGKADCVYLKIWLKCIKLSHHWEVMPNCPYVPYSKLLWRKLKLETVSRIAHKIKLKKKLSQRGTYIALPPKSIRDIYRL